jgi:hypothetical protein
MSWQAVKLVMESSKAPASARHVLLVIAYHANLTTGDSFPSLATLSDETGLGRRQIINLVAQLECSGELGVVRQPGVANHYRLPTSATRFTGRGHALVQSPQPPVQSTSPVPVQSATPTGEPEFTRTVGNREAEPEEEPPRSSLQGTSDCFVIFHHLTGRVANTRERKWIDDLVEEQGDRSVVAAAMRAIEDPRKGSLLGRVSHRLRNGVAA